VIKRLQQERGAVAVLTAASMLFVLAAVALSVDIGDMIWRQRQVQGIVDMASLDAIRALGDRRDTSSRCSQALTYAQQAANRNSFDYSLSGWSLTVYLGTVDASRNWTQLGNSCNSDTTYNPTSATAVRVVAKRPVAFGFMPGSDDVLADAIATTTGLADLHMGTWAARVNTTYLSQYDKLLTCMGKGGGTCNNQTSSLTAVGYSGLASATINLGSLFSSLSIGTTDAIANTSVNYKNFLTAAATILNAQGGTTNVNAATALTSLAATADNTLSFKFGDFITTTSGYNNVASLNMNVSDLIGAAVEAGNQAHFVEVDNLGLSIPGVSSFNMKMSVIEPPQWGWGAADGSWSVHTAQIRSEFDLSVGSVLVGLTSVPITLKLYVETANGTGTLTNIACAADPANGSVTVNASTSAVTLYIGEVSNSAMTNVSVDPAQSNGVSAATMANVAGLVKITGSGSMSLAGANNATVTLSGPFTRTGTIGTFTTNTDTLRNNLSLTVTSLGLPVNVGTVSTAVANLVKPVLDVVDTTLLNVIDTLPGISFDLAGADLWNTWATCTTRKLVG
jgi:uncharacterized membrane protein